LADAEEMMAHHCRRAGLAKTRYFVPHGGHTWQVDVYQGVLAGVVLPRLSLRRRRPNLCCRPGSAGKSPAILPTRNSTW
jgi:CYTH domain-containing protein